MIIDYAIHVLGLRIIYADAVHRNTRSKHILEKLGFSHLYNDEILAYYELRAELPLISIKSSERAK